MLAQLPRLCCNTPIDLCELAEPVQVSCLCGNTQAGSLLLGLSERAVLVEMPCRCCKKNGLPD